jgi:hypothetical protein
MRPNGNRQALRAHSGAISKAGAIPIPSGLLCLPVLCLSYKKRTQISEQHLRQMVEADHDRESTAPSQISVIDSTALICVTYIRVAVTGTPDLAPLQALTRVEGIYCRFRLLPESVTDHAMLSKHSNDVAPELVSSSEEDEDDRPSALLSAVPGGISAAVRTLHMVLMDSVHCPDSVMSSGMAAEGSVAYAKTTTTLYEHGCTANAVCRSQLPRLHLGLPARPATIVERGMALCLWSRSVVSDPES